MSICASDDNLWLGFILPAQIVACEIKNWERQEQHKLSSTTICAGADNLWCEVLQNFAQSVADDNLCRDNNLWCNIRSSSKPYQRCFLPNVEEILNVCFYFKFVFIMITQEVTINKIQGWFFGSLSTDAYAEGVTGSHPPPPPPRIFFFFCFLSEGLVMYDNMENVGTINWGRRKKDAESTAWNKLYTSLKEKKEMCTLLTPGDPVIIPIWKCLSLMKRPHVRCTKYIYFTLYQG